jgi:hypothetical protein
MRRVRWSWMVENELLCIYIRGAMKRCGKIFLFFVELNGEVAHV